MAKPVKSLKQNEPQNLRFQAFDWLPTPIAVELKVIAVLP